MSGDGNRKSSKAWQFFTDLINGKAKCNFCQKEFSYRGGGAYNLIRHTKSKHPQVFAAVRERPHENIASSATEIHNFTTLSHSITQGPEIPTTSTSTTSTSTAPGTVMPETSDFLPATTICTDLYKKTPATNTKLTQYFYKPLSAKKTENLNKMLVKVFTKNYLSFHLIESPELRDFIKDLNPAYQLPSRKTLSNALMTNVYNQTKEKVKTELCQAEYVCIKTDGWTSGPNDNYLAVTVHFINHQAELKSFLLECVQFPDRHTSENLAHELKRITNMWDITDKIVAATSDNAFNIKAAIKLNNWKHIPCFAHTLNLIVLSALKEIKEVTTKIKHIVEVFRRSPLASERLKNMQKKLGELTLKLKQDVSTRWNSTCDMYERLLKIKNSVMSTIAIDYTENINITSEDIEVLDSAVQILSFFKDVTEEMSSEKNVTISEVILISNALKRKCVKFLSSPHPDRVLQMVQVLLNEINARFSGIEENYIFAESTVLDPRFKKYGFENEFAYGRACSNLKAMAGRIQIHSPIDKYLEEPLLPRSQNPTKWWLAKKDAYPRVYKLFLKRLCIVATSVPSERTFSKAGQILTDRRNRLSGKKVTQILFLQYNL